MLSQLTATAEDSPITQIMHQISVRGAKRAVPALSVNGHVIVIGGRFVKVGKIFDAYWLEAHSLPHPPSLVERLRGLECRPDLFTFTERVPQTQPRFDYHLEWDNVAAVPVTSHDHWMRSQISSASRRNVRTSEKKGVTVRVSKFDESYIRGIMSISDESPIRAGRRYWHYAKDFATVDAEQGTYRDRATFLGAYLGDEMIGYLKLVWDAHTAAIMQIVSKLKHLDKRPNNALLSEAVRLCADRGVSYLQYERFVYGNKDDSSLTRFKRENGFVRINVPEYYVPLTSKGRIALTLGLHRNLKDHLPSWLTNRLLSVREQWYSRRTRQ